MASDRREVPATAAAPTTIDRCAMAARGADNSRACVVYYGRSFRERATMRSLCVGDGSMGFDGLVELECKEY